MATHMVDRSTYWVETNTNTPNSSGDYRYYWKIYYETDKANRQTNFTVKYYLQTHCTNYTENSINVSTPEGTANVQINGKSIGTKYTPETVISKGANYSLKYLTEKTFSISHNNDGSAKFDFQGFGFGIGTALSTYSTANGNFPSIPSQSKLGEIKTFDIDSGISSIGITKYVDGYYDVLQISNGSNVFKTINGFKNSDPVTFTETELDNIYTKIPTGDKATFTFKLTTYTNSDKTTVVGTDTKTVIGNFTIVLPTVKGAVCTDNIKNMPTWTGDSTNQTIIKNQSLVVVTIPSSMHAIANTRCATIKEYIIEQKHVTYNVNGNSVDLWEEDEDGNIDFETANIYNNKDYVTIYAVDSRETSSLPFVQKFTKYVPYEKLSCNNKTASVVRDNGGVGRQVTLSVEGTWWNGNFGAVQNALEFEVYYRNAEDGYWNSFDEFREGASIGQIDTSLIDLSETGKFKYNGPVMSTENDKGFDVKYSYDIVMIVYDEMDNRGFYITVEYGEPAIAVYKNKPALGGPYDEQLGGTQLWGDIYVNGEPHHTSSEINAAIQRHIVSACLSSNHIDSYTAWSGKIVPFDEINTIGNKLIYDTTNNCVVVGAGVSKVRVTGSIFYCGRISDNDDAAIMSAEQLRAFCEFYDKDGTGKGGFYTTPSYMYNSGKGVNIMVPMPERILNVNEGDTIRLSAQVSSSTTVCLLSRGTTLLVEVIE